MGNVQCIERGVALGTQPTGTSMGTIAADCLVGDHRALKKALLWRHLQHVLAQGVWARSQANNSLAEAARARTLRLKKSDLSLAADAWTSLDLFRSI